MSEVKDRFTKNQKDENGKQVPYFDLKNDHVPTGGTLRDEHELFSTRIFASGAKWQGDMFGRTVDCREPPFSEEDTLRFRLEYVRPVLEKERHDFDHYKSTVLKLANRHFNTSESEVPPEDAAEILTAALGRIQALEAEVSDIRKTLLEMPGTAEYEAVAQRRRAAAEEQQRQSEMVSYQKKINDIQRATVSG